MLSKKQISKAINLLSKNKIIIMPTDTIYGLTAIINDNNKKLINAFKNIEDNKPLIILFSKKKHLKMLNVNAKKFKHFYASINKKIPTTLIMESANSQDKKNTIAIRKIYKKDIKKIIDKVGPVYSSSVNKHKEPPLNTYNDLNNFNNLVSVIFDNQSQNFNSSKIYNTITKEWIR